MADWDVPKKWKGLKKIFADRVSADLQAYLKDYPKLLDDFDWHVSIAYLLSRIEQGHRRTLYATVVKLHRVDADLAWKAIQLWEMKRAEFRAVVGTILGSPVDSAIWKALDQAEEVRDDAIHGRHFDDKAARRGSVRALQYLQAFEEHVIAHATLSPFGDLRGFSGAAQKLSPGTSRLVLKGLGFPLS